MEARSNRWFGSNFELHFKYRQTIVVWMEWAPLINRWQKLLGQRSIITFINGATSSAFNLHLLASGCRPVPKVFMLSLLPANKPIIIPLKQRGPGHSGRRSSQREEGTGDEGKGVVGAARSTVIPESQRLTHPAGLKIKWAHPVHDLCARGKDIPDKSWWL